MSFVKLNAASADFIWSNNYHLTPTLRALNARFDRDGTAPVERSIKPFPQQLVLATIAGVLLLLGLVAEVGARRTARLAQPDLLRAVQE